MFVHALHYKIYMHLQIYKFIMCVPYLSSALCRPIAGFVNFCPDAFMSGISDEFAFSVTKHEIFHALVWNIKLHVHMYTKLIQCKIVHTNIHTQSQSKKKAPSIRQYTINIQTIII